MNSMWSYRIIGYYTKHNLNQSNLNYQLIFELSYFHLYQIVLLKRFHYYKAKKFIFDQFRIYLPYINTQHFSNHHCVYIISIFIKLINFISRNSKYYLNYCYLLKYSNYRYAMIHYYISIKYQIFVNLSYLIIISSY